MSAKVGPTEPIEKGFRVKIPGSPKTKYVGAPKANVAKGLSAVGSKAGDAIHIVNPGISNLRNVNPQGPSVAGYGKSFGSLIHYPCSHCRCQRKIWPSRGLCQNNHWKSDSLA